MSEKHYREEDIEECNQAIRNLLNQGMFTLLEEDPAKGFRVAIGPELREIITSTGCTDEEIARRAATVMALRQLGLISTEDGLDRVFAPKTPGGES